MASLTSKAKDRKGKKTVAIVGMAKTSRDSTPWYDKAVDVWVLNESHAHNYIKRLNRIFQLHPDWDYMRKGNFNDPIYPEFLQNLPWSEEDLKALEKANTYKKLPAGFPEIKLGNKRRPEDLEIILLEEDADIPGKQSMFPFGDIMKSYGNLKRMRYFTSSAPYMIALALHEGYERIEIYGFEMSSAEEYSYQKPCMEFWLGIAVGKIGAENVYLPPECKLLGETTKLYGYDKIPGYTSMHAEIRRNGLGREKMNAEKAYEKAKTTLNHIEQNLQVAQNKGDNAWMQKLLPQRAQAQQRYLKTYGHLNAIHGGFQEAGYVQQALMNLPTTEEIKPIPPDKLS